MLGGLGVGAHQQKAPIGEMRARGPYLLPVDDEMIAVVDGTGAQAREIAAGIGLGKTLAPQFVGVQDPRQVALLLLLGAPMNEARAQQVQAARARQDRRAGADIFLVEDDLLHEIGAAPAIFLGPGDPDPTRGVHRLLPLNALFQCLAVGCYALVGRVIDTNLRRQVGGEPLPELGAKLGMLRTVGEIHEPGSYFAVTGGANSRLRASEPSRKPGAASRPLRPIQPARSAVLAALIFG